MKYYNYHCHNHKGNVITLDVIVKLEDYCKRAVELGHDAIFTTCHGMQGDIFEATTLAHQYGLKLIVGAEMYYVSNRLEKDKSNRHIILIALNNDGVRDLNRIISEANETGFYYKPRIDDELLFSINPKNVVITTACIAGLWNNEPLILKMKDYFKDNFFLEVQDHNEDGQKGVNQEVLRLHYKYNIPIIHANDSHYIYPEDSKYRDLFLKAKGIIYAEENNFILDYPDYDTIINRYKKQGILNDNEIDEALQNTYVFEKSENINIINDDIKLPSVSKNPKLELRKIIKEAWEKEKKNINPSLWDKYEKEIKYEVDIVEKTNMMNYFIIDHKIVKIAQEKHDGVLTRTGRGSAPSFFIVKLLGLTDIDRISAPITLFPTRFMSVERILGARSLPDIDLNSADAEPFIKASEDLLGKENCAWLIAWKPLQSSSAFRLYCKAKDENINDYENIAKELSELAKTKHQYTDSSYINDPKWGKLIEESRVFVGVVEGISESPCSELLYDKPVKEEIGMIRTKTKMCCLLDGYNCDKYKYLKNDYLTVQVWAIIRDVCKLANIEIPSILELNKLLDEKTFEIYKNGLTCSINQADSDYATGLIKRYKPKSVEEMSAFVAIIRPGCASLLNDFIDRKDYTTGVKELDNILEDGAHRMIYQELIMKYLIWLGVPETGSYDIIKKIAKKKFKEAELKELKEKLVLGWIKQVGSEKGFEDTWQVVNDAAKYSFNSSHSLSYAYDSLYGAYLKSHYPLEYYTIALNYYSNDEERTQKLIKEIKYFNIDLKPPKFGKSLATYFMDKENNTIYKGVASLKFMNEQTAKDLYDLSQNKKYNSFVELLYDILFKSTTNSRQVEILIKAGYFSQFGKTLHLLGIYREFKDGKNRITKTLKEKSLNNRLEALKTLDKDDTIIVEDIKDIDIVRFKIKNGIDQDFYSMVYGNREFIITDINYFKTGGKAKASIIQLSSGNIFQVKFKTIKHDSNFIGLYDHIYVNNLQYENKWYLNENKEWKQYTDVENQKEYIVYKFEILSKYKEEKGDK